MLTPQSKSLNSLKKHLVGLERVSQNYQEALYFSLIVFQHYELSIGFGIMPPNKIMAFDSKALNGLRGFAAFHIMLLHVLMESNPGINIFGAVSHTE